MKKTKRIISVFIIAVLCCTLCGCTLSKSDIEEMRRHHAVRNELDRTSVTFNGNVYKLLPECSTLSPNVNMAETVYLTESDIPLILSSSIGIAFNPSYDGYFLDNHYTYSSEIEQIYCREDIYDSVLKQINEGPELSSFCYSYVDYSDKQFSDIRYIFTDAETEAVNEVLSQNPTIEKLYRDYTYAIDVLKCTPDALFLEEAFTVCTINGEYYIVVYGEETYIYQVPNSLSDTFEGIMSKYVESENLWKYSMEPTVSDDDDIMY